jgi:hypothetical protein
MTPAPKDLNIRWREAKLARETTLGKQYPFLTKRAQFCNAGDHFLDFFGFFGALKGASGAKKCPAKNFVESARPNGRTLLVVGASCVGDFSGKFE